MVAFVSLVAALAVVVAGCGGGADTGQQGRLRDTGRHDRSRLTEAIQEVGAATTVKGTVTALEQCQAVFESGPTTWTAIVPPADIEEDHETLATASASSRSNSTRSSTASRTEPAGGRGRPGDAVDDDDHPRLGRHRPQGLRPRRGVGSLSGALPPRVVAAAPPSAPRDTRGRRRAASTRADRRRAGGAPCRGRRPGCWRLSERQAISAR